MDISGSDNLQLTKKRISRYSLVGLRLRCMGENCRGGCRSWPEMVWVRRTGWRMRSEEVVSDWRSTCSGGAESTDDDRSRTAIWSGSCLSDPAIDAKLDPLSLSQRHVSSRTLARKYLRPSLVIDSALCIDPTKRILHYPRRLCINLRVYVMTTKLAVLLKYRNKWVVNVRFGHDLRRQTNPTSVQFCCCCRVLMASSARI